MTLVARHAVRTDIGLHREANEDAAVARPPLYAVCDGMGGARAGEVASDLACSTLGARVAAGDDVVDAARAANSAVYDAAVDDESLAGMGTTLTAMVLDGDVARFAHVGDSRAYLLRGGELRQVSVDHSVVGQMIRDGELTLEQAAVHPMRSILTRALGTEPSVEVDAYELALRADDVVLLCSDGLTGMVPDERIRRALRHDDPGESAAELVKQARRGGGLDNITVVVVCFAEADDDAAGLAAAGASSGAAAAAGAALADTAATGDLTPGDAPATAADDGPVAEPVGAGGPAAPADAAAASPLEAAPRAASAPPAAEREARTMRRLKIVLAVLLVLLVLAVGAAVSLQAVYFVGVDDGDVVVFSGLPWALGPLKIQDVYVRGTRAYDSLTPMQQQLVDEARLQSRDGALGLLESLETLP
ncbi:MAG: Stp1/IreP family PP2C-type Ser/Thr phosphatase [Thermoleophilia bacterium]|nr:Stp1/IreP family PP2C-type Ser/Thr phosphatase [Thermoleophilia bacterium]